MQSRKKTLKERIKAGEVGRRDVVRRLAELAFGRVNDCVKLALGETEALDGLDLSLLSEVKRNEKGLVEVKLIDRLQVLRQLAEAAQEERDGVEGLLQSLGAGKEEA